jgi:uncharacterized protein YdhG (YjbR/CyaY superfamily)
MPTRRPAPPQPRIAPEVTDYIASVPRDHRPIFDRLHDLVLDTLPDARAVISYNMPAYVVDGVPGGRVSLSSGKTTVSLATTIAEPVRAFGAKHPRFRTGKVTVQFPPDADLPEDDLRTLILDATRGRSGGAAA